MQEVDPGLYSDYQKERIVEGFWVPRRRKRELPPLEAAETEASEPKQVSSDDPLRVLKRVDTLREDHYARKFCENRMLPDLSKVYHCPRFFAWTNYIIEDKFKKGALAHDEPRLIIPFFREDGTLFAYQGRSYKLDSEVKYITIRIDESVPKIYGLDQCDRTRDVYALEGPLDSMFLDNAVAFAGGSHATLAGHLEPKNTVLVYDNEPRSPETKEKMLKGAEAGFGVVVWPKHVTHKDVNKMVQKGMSPDIIQDIIKKHTYRGLAAESEIKLWSRA